MTLVESTPETRHRPSVLHLVAAAIIILVPVVGDVACTVLIIGDDLTVGEKILWIVACWLTQWIGRTLYLLVGQRRNRLLGGRA